MRVETCCHPSRDVVAVRIESPLIASGRLAVTVAFPYGSPGRSGADWDRPEAHRTMVTRRGHQRVDFARQLDRDRYWAGLAWTGRAVLTEQKPHSFDW